MPNVKTNGCPLLSKDFIACGKATLSSAATEVAINGVVETDLVLATLHTDDTGTSITQLRAAAGAGKITLTRTDDGSSQDDGVAQYFVIRPE